MSRYIAYIDGFNLFGKIKELKQNKKVNLKWLDIETFIKINLNKDIPNLNLVKIKYFTARVLKDKSSIYNQTIYFKALKTINNLEIIEGTFKKVYLTGSVWDIKKKIKLKARKTIVKKEEKESDVNIGIHMINDCHIEKNLSGIILVTSDTDLTPVLKLVKTQFPKINRILMYRSSKGSNSLKKLSSRKYKITKSNLEKSQFPEIIESDSIRKPKEWN